MAFALFAPASKAQQTCSSPGGYYVASLNADIDPGASNFMATSISNAEALCATHFIFVLTTNGGDGGDMESMIGSIASYEQWNGNSTTFITLVAPQGAYAFSAGSYIAQASDSIVMVPGTTIGSATPIVSGIPTGETNTTLRKDINAFASYMETLTASHGRNATATGLMVTEGVSYPCASATDCQALDLGVVNRVLNTTTVQGALALLGVPSSTPINTPGIAPVLLSILSNPDVSTLLFLIGVFAILADIYHPTIVLSVIGVAVVAMALYGLGVFGASPLAILLMIVGSAFIFLEIKTQHGVSAAAGVVIFIIGFLLIFQFPPSSGPSSTLPPVLFFGIPEVTYALLFALGVTIVITALYLRSIRQGMMNRPKANDPARLVGREGTMRTDLAPGGKGVVLVGSEEWSAVSSDDLHKGDAVKVKEVKGLELSVEKLQK